MISNIRIIVILRYIYLSCFAKVFYICGQQFVLIHDYIEYSFEITYHSFNYLLLMD